jgi:hypothetical protein
METSNLTHNKFNIILAQHNLFYMQVKLNFIIQSSNFSQILKACLLCSTDF